MTLRDYLFYVYCTKVSCLWKIWKNLKAFTCSNEQNIRLNVKLKQVNVNEQKYLKNART